MPREEAVNEVVFTEDRQVAFRRRVLEARLRHLDQAMAATLGRIENLAAVGLGAEAGLAESYLTDLTREALRHRRALEAGAQILEPMALVG
jgi:hypothetical protein